MPSAIVLFDATHAMVRGLQEVGAERGCEVYNWQLLSLKVALAVASDHGTDTGTCVESLKHLQLGVSAKRAYHVSICAP
jgi:hypothetical protein